MSVQRKRWKQCWFKTDLIVNWVKFVLEVLQAKVLPVFFSAGGDKISRTRPHAAGRRTLPNTRTYRDARRPWWEEKSVSCVPRLWTCDWSASVEQPPPPAASIHCIQMSHCTWKHADLCTLFFSDNRHLTDPCYKNSNEASVDCWLLIHYGVIDTNEGDLGNSLPIDWFLFKSS